MKSYFTNTMSGLVQRHFFALTLGFLCLSTFLPSTFGDTECWKRKYHVNVFGMALNATIKCQMYFQWTVSDYCCYDKYDRFENNPFCCYSETYKLAIAVGFICLILVGMSCCVFFCWIYNLPHHILFILTCRKFHLNNWLLRNKNGPYVDPSFYAGEPFWARGSENQPAYPLRPMPPRIFYPAAPNSMKFRWDMANGQMPLFVLASRQFTRNPYSARPNERQVPSLFASFGGSMGSTSTPDSRRSSTGTIAEKDMSCREPSVAFKVNMDEMEAAAELLEALKNMEDKCEKGLLGWAVAENVGLQALPEETVKDLGELKTVPVITRPYSSNDADSILRDARTASSNNCMAIIPYRMSIPSVHNLGLPRKGSRNCDALLGRGGVAIVTAIMESINERDSQSPDIGEDQAQPENTLNVPSSSDDEFKGSISSTGSKRPSLTDGDSLESRISSALERSATTSMAVVPFIPSLPGRILELSEDSESQPISSDGAIAGTHKSCSSSVGKVNDNGSIAPSRQNCGDKVF